MRELIVVELFPMNAPIPRTMRDVLQRMVQLQYTSRLTLDEKFFEKTDRVVDLLAKIDQFVNLLAKIDGGLPEDIRSDPRYREMRDIRSDPAYGELRRHRKINHLNVVTASLPAELSNASDFSRSSVEARIQVGHEDAIEQGIGRVNAPGLRPGVTGAGSEPATSG